MVEMGNRKSAGDVLQDAAAAANSSETMPASSRSDAKVWQPNALSFISGLPVFGPQPLLGKGDIFKFKGS